MHPGSERRAGQAKMSAPILARNPQPVFAQPSSPHPVFGKPSSPQPVFGKPSPPPPVFGQPSSGGSVFHWHAEQVSGAIAWPRCLQAQPPPVLYCGKYTAWTRECVFRMELYGILPDSYLVSVIGHGATSTLGNGYGDVSRR